MAEYLRGGMEAKPATEKVLEKLSLPQAAPTVAEAKTAAPAAAPKVDDKKLEALAQAGRTSCRRRKHRQRRNAKPVDLSKADEKLVVAAGKTER